MFWRAPLAEIVTAPGNVLVNPWSAPPLGELTEPGDSSVSCGGIAPVQRQLGNAGLFDHLSDGRGHGIDLGRVAFHLDYFASRSHFQLQAHSQSLVGQQGDVLPGIAEPFGLDVYGVVGGTKRRHEIISPGVGCGLASKPGANLRDRDLRRNDGSAGRIGNRSRDASQSLSVR